MPVWWIKQIMSPNLNEIIALWTLKNFGNLKNGPTQCNFFRYDYIRLLMWQQMQFGFEPLPFCFSPSSVLSFWVLFIIKLSCRWKLVEIDADLLKLTSETKHVMSLINPARTYMVFSNQYLYEYVSVTLSFWTTIKLLNYFFLASGSEYWYCSVVGC